MLKGWDRIEGRTVQRYLIFEAWKFGTYTANILCKYMQQHKCWCAPMSLRHAVDIFSMCQNLVVPYLSLIWDLRQKPQKSKYKYRDNFRLCGLYVRFVVCGQYWSDENESGRIKDCPVSMIGLCSLYTIYTIHTVYSV